MATSKAQRWGILVILIVTVVGTLGSFAVMGLSTQNDAADAAKQQKIIQDYQSAYSEYQTKVDAQTKELSDKYYATFSPYASRVGVFDRDSIKDIVTEDLVVGEGTEITGATKFAAYYIGWNPKGKVFDQSISGESLKEPIYHSKPEQGFVGLDQGIDKANLIEGWKEGMKGMRIGGIRMITIPSDKAYGEQGSGDDIPPNTPIAFIVMAVEPPAAIATPEIPAELMQGFGG
jgi:FKBP-type peptidyl-prolyl cis-trans isomerase